METKRERNLELRGISVLIAVVVALMGFSAALATKPQAEAAAATETSAASAYQDRASPGWASATTPRPTVRSRCSTRRRLP